MGDIVKKSTEYMLTHFVKDNELADSVTDYEMRKKYAYLEAWVSIIGNLILAAIKILLGIALNSISLLADAAHTASDVLTSVVVLLGFKVSSSPADEKHPYGHGRIEFLATLIIAVMLIIVGIQFGKTSYERFIANSIVKGSYSVALVMLIGALFKEWMSRFSIELGMRINSSALIADAWHHRTDAIASVLVAIAIVASGFGYYKVDAIFGLGVSALIIYTGIGIARESASKLIGEAAEKDMIVSIKECALNVPGVIGIHKINVHDYGAQKIISLHIQVDKTMSLIKAHDISEQVERVIEEANVGSKAIVHVEPDLVVQNK
jgi:cation diffusion facilitator family transporter